MLVQSGVVCSSNIPHFQESFLQLSYQRLCHLPINVVAVSTNLVKYQIIHKLHYFEVFLGKYSTPWTYMFCDIRELCQIIPAK